MNMAYIPCSSSNSHSLILCSPQLCSCWAYLGTLAEAKGYKHRVSFADISALEIVVASNLQAGLLLIFLQS